MLSVRHARRAPQTGQQTPALDRDTSPGPHSVTVAPPAVDLGFANQSEQPGLYHSLSWSALFTYPRHEKKVAEQLLCRGVESFLPLYAEKRTWKNRQTVTLTLPLFPGYVFARFARRDRVRVMSLPGVVSIVERAGAVSSISDHYIEKLRAGIRLGRVRPFREAILGDRVQITSGPLSGLEGVLMHFRSEFRVVVSIGMIGQSVSIEVLRDEIALLPSSRERRMV